jgi:small subunit ribosomal protein S13
MPRVIGVDIPGKKRVAYALRYIYGVGPARAQELVERLKIDPAKKADDLSGEEIAALSKMLQEEYVVEGDLRREVSGNIRRLIAVNCYRGIRHRKGLPSAASAPAPTRAPARGPQDRRRRPRQGRPARPPRAAAPARRPRQQESRKSDMAEEKKRRIEGRRRAGRRRSRPRRPAEAPAAEGEGKARSRAAAPRAPRTCPWAWSTSWASYSTTPPSASPIRAAT